jgi:flagellar protein FliT
MKTEMEFLLEVSEALLLHIKEEAMFKDNRKDYLDTLKKLLDQRQTAIDSYEWAKIKISTEQITFNEEEKSLAKNIVEVDNQITILLEQRTVELQQERRKTYQKGKSITKYRRPYQGPTRDGIFFDKKK